jgi:hypothetical protein
MTWDQVILLQLIDKKPVLLKNIYERIDKGLRGGYINPVLFSVNQIYGDRQRLTHATRAGMNNLQKRGLVQHVGQGRTGIYRITEAGQKYLSEIEP